MLHIIIGRWLSFDKRRRLTHLLIVAIWAAGCSRLQPPNKTASVVPLTPTSLAVSTATIAKTQLQPKEHGYTLPSWTQVELPLGCGFHSMSPNLQWVLYGGCHSETSSGYTDWIAEIDEHGQLVNPRQLGFKLASDHGDAVGFTFDGARLIVKQDTTFLLVDPRDLTQQPYVANTTGVSGINSLGSERWSPNGYQYLAFGRLGVGEILIASLNRDIEETILDNLNRQDSQFNWCSNGDEIAYVEGDMQGVMRAQVFNLQSRKSRILIDSQFPVNITGASCSPDGNRIAIREQNVATDETTLLLIDSASGVKNQLTYKLTNGPDALGGWQDMLWSPDGSKMALRGSRSNISDGFIIIELSTGKIVFQGDKGKFMRPLAWSTNGKYMLARYSRSSSTSTYLNDILQWVEVLP